MTKYNKDSDIFSGDPDLDIKICLDFLDKELSNGEFEQVKESIVSCFSIVMEQIEKLRLTLRSK